MNRKLYGVMALGLLLGGCGLHLSSSVPPKPLPPPRHLQAFVPNHNRLQGHRYFAALATEILWAQPPGYFPDFLWLEFVQKRHQRWHTVYQHRWKDTTVLDVTQRANPTTSESDLIVSLVDGGNTGYTTLANFLVSPTHVTLSRAIGGIGNTVTAGRRRFREEFSTFVEQFAWRGASLHHYYKGPLATIPTGAVVRPVYIEAAHLTPTIGGSATVHVRPGQPVAIRPATPYALNAFEQARLGLFGPFDSVTAAQTAAVETADTIAGLSYEFSHRGVYYLDVVSNPYSTTPRYRILTVAVGHVQIPKATVTFGTGFDKASFSLTGVASTFTPGSNVYWLLDDLTQFGTTSIQAQLYTVQGATDQLLHSNTFTVDPQFAEVENTVSSSFGTYLGAGTYKLIFITHNKVLASGTFTVH